MKVLCDFCEKAVATVICCADEAALCASCDARVHHANKLASNHQRVPLITPATATVSQGGEASCPTTLCDICQERSSFFLCVEDRALLCRECDVCVHSANAFSAKHRRFLLTGVRVALDALSITPTSSPISPSFSLQHDQVSTITCQQQHKKQQCDSIELQHQQGQRPPQGSANARPAQHHLQPLPSPYQLLQHSSASAFSSSQEPQTQSSFRTSDLMISSKQPAASPHGPPDLLKSTPGLSIQRLSSGQVSFIAPFLSTVLSSSRNSAPEAKRAKLRPWAASNRNGVEEGAGTADAAISWMLEELLDEYCHGKGEDVTRHSKVLSSWSQVL